MFCSKCGAKNDDSAKFCEKCGEPLNKSSSEKEIVVSIEDTKRNKKVGIISVIVCASYRCHTFHCFRRKKL